MRASIEVADIFRAAGPTYRASHAGHLSLHQLKVISAIEHCRIRHYGLLASTTHKANVALARELLGVATPPEPIEPEEPIDNRPSCPCCGGRMSVIETFERWRQPRPPPSGAMSTRNVAP